MQRLLQANREKGPVLCVSRGEELRHRQKAAESMSILSLPEMSQLRYEAGGGARGATTGLEESKGEKNEQLYIAQYFTNQLFYCTLE